MKRLVTTCASIFACILLGTGSAFAAGVVLNEIRIDHSGTDTDEYVELAGPAGTALTGLTLVVIGDAGAAPTCGSVEASIDLSPYSIQADGFFALRYSGGVAVLAGYDATISGSFENSDNLTFLLVTGSAPAVNADLDTDDNGTLDSPPWTSIVDQVGVYEGVLPIDCITNEYLYTSVVVGPDGSFVPGHVYRCGANWYIGPFGTSPWPTGAIDTPGSDNAGCATPARKTTWGVVKMLYR